MSVRLPSLGAGGSATATAEHRTRAGLRRVVGGGHARRRVGGTAWFSEGRVLEERE